MKIFSVGDFQKHLCHNEISLASLRKNESQTPIFDSFSIFEQMTFFMFQKIQHRALWFHKFCVLRSEVQIETLTYAYAFIRITEENHHPCGKYVIPSLENSFCPSPPLRLLPQVECAKNPTVRKRKGLLFYHIQPLAHSRPGY
jgi:hypothetical protein